MISLELSVFRLAFQREFMKEKGLAWELVRACAGRLPFKRGTANVIICNHLLEHISDPYGSLDDMLSLLRPGGMLYVNFPNRYAIRQIIRDKHYRLPLVALLPRSVAAFIVTKLFKREKEYSTNVFISPFQFMGHLRALGLKYCMVQPDMGLIAGKIGGRIAVRNAAARKAFGLLRALGLDALVVKLLSLTSVQSLMAPNYAFAIINETSDIQRRHTDA